MGSANAVHVIVRARSVFGDDTARGLGKCFRLGGAAHAWAPRDPPPIAASRERAGALGGGDALTGLTSGTLGSRAPASTPSRPGPLTAWQAWCSVR